MRHKNIVFINSQNNFAFSGGHSVTQNIIKCFRDKAKFTFIGRDKFWTEMFKKNGFKTFSGVSGVEPVTAIGLILFPVSIFMGFYFFFRYFFILKRSDIIVFNATFTEAFYILPLLRFFRSTKVIHTIHANKVPTVFKRTVLGKLLIYLWNNDKVVFVSESQLQEWKDNNIAPKNSQIILNGVKVSTLKTTKKVEHKPVFGYIGRLEGEKGIDLLVYSLKNSDIEFKLEIAGRGSLENSLKKITSGDKRFDFKGHVNDIKAFLRGIDVLICPSLKESFGLVVCESWEQGVSVICSDIPVFKELKSYTNTEEQKLIFENSSAKDLLSKIEYFISNKSIYELPRHRVFLHNLVKSKFSIDKMMSEYKNLFRV